MADDFIPEDDFPPDIEFDPDADEQAEADMREDLEKFEEGTMDSKLAGITRQILGKKTIQEGLNGLSEKQAYLYHNEIEPSLTEKCGWMGCTNVVRVGSGYCGGH